MPAIGTSTFLLQGPGWNCPRFPNIQSSCCFAHSVSFTLTRSQSIHVSTNVSFSLLQRGNTSMAHRHQAGATPEAGQRQLQLSVAGKAQPGHSQQVHLSWPQSPAQGLPKLENCRMFLENFLPQTPTPPVLPAGSGRLEKVCGRWAEAPRARGINPTAFQPPGCWKSFYGPCS